MDGEPQQPLETSGMGAVMSGSANVQGCSHCQVTSDLMLVSDCISLIKVP